MRFCFCIFLITLSIPAYSIPQDPFSKIFSACKDLLSKKTIVNTHKENLEIPPQQASACPYHKVMNALNLNQNKSDFTIKLDHPLEVLKISSTQFAYRAFERKTPHQFIQHLHANYGSLVKYSFPLSLKKDIYFISDNGLIETILQNTDKSSDPVFERASNRTKALIKPFGNRSLFSDKKEVWKASREKFAPQFTPKSVQDFEFRSTIQEIISEHLDHIQKNKTIDLPSFTQEITIKVAFQTLFNYKATEEELTTIRKNINALLAGSLIDLFNPLSSSVVKFPTLSHSHKKIKDAYQEMDALFEKIIELQSTQQNNSGVLPILFEMHGGPTGDLNALKSQMIVWTIAGFSSLSQILDWTIYSILNDQKIYNTINSITADHNIDGAYDYLRNTFEEGSRLFSIAPYLTRKTNADLKITHDQKEITIPKGSTLLLSTMVANRNPKILEQTGFNANEFHPERFDEDQIRKSGASKKSMKNLSFSLGPRICIGAHFAREEAVILLYQLFKRFNLRFTQGLELPRGTVVENRLVFPNQLEIIPKVTPLDETESLEQIKH